MTNKGLWTTVRYLFTYMSDSSDLFEEKKDYSENSDNSATNYTTGVTLSWI